MDILNHIQAFLASAMGASATIAVVIEFVLRMVPSKKPLSILYVVGDVAHKVGAILVGLGDLIDKIIPQKLSQ